MGVVMTVYKKKRLAITFNAPVTLWFVILCFGATLAGILTGGSATSAYFMTYHSSLANPMTYIRFFTHVLGHGGWEHFIGNASYLLLLGPLLEEKNGSGTTSSVIILTALVTGIINYIFFPTVGLCGASGVVFAFIMLSSLTGFKEGEIPLTFILVLVIYIGQQVYQGIFIQDNVSNMAHIVGGLVGSVIGFLLNRGRR
jgi:GlpG protein